MELMCTDFVDNVPLVVGIDYLGRDKGWKLWSRSEGEARNALSLTGNTSSRKKR